MTSSWDKKDPIESAVEKAEHNPEFTKDEIEALKRVADAWRGLESLGRMAGIVRKILIFIGWGVAAWIAIRFALTDWVKGIKT